ncbi:MAG: hypothetical protein WA555_10305 [Candidatus Sulfotelmatobacter sp.]
MKKQPADAKKAAANDKENGNGKATTKRSKPTEDAKYVVGSIETVRRGFLKLFVEFIQKKGSVSAEQLVAEFQGRSVEGKKITAERCHRYLNYCRVNGIVKVAK